MNEKKLMNLKNILKKMKLLELIDEIGMEKMKS